LSSSAVAALPRNHPSLDPRRLLALLGERCVEVEALRGEVERLRADAAAAERARQAQAQAAQDVAAQAQVLAAVPALLDELRSQRARNEALALRVRELERAHMDDFAPERGPRDGY
jgi:hypothetical protein